MVTGFVQTLERPGIKMLRFPGLESPGKRHRSWKTLEKSWNSKVVVLEILFLVQVSLTLEEIHCKMLCAICYLLGQFEFQLLHLGLFTVMQVH